MKLRLPPGINIAPVLKKQASQRGRSAKARGARFEKLMAETIAAWIDMPVSDVLRTRTGAFAADVGFSEEAAKRFPFHVECKDHRTLHIPDWIRQVEAAVEQKGNNLTPIVIFRHLLQRGAGEKARHHVVIDFDSFMKLVTKNKDW